MREYHDREKRLGAASREECTRNGERHQVTQDVLVQETGANLVPGHLHVAHRRRGQTEAERRAIRSLRIAIDVRVAAGHFDVRPHRTRGDHVDAEDRDQDCNSEQAVSSVELGALARPSVVAQPAHAGPRKSDHRKEGVLGEDAA